MSESLDTWFTREILAHEASLMRYLRRIWLDHAELPDLRQEAYVRVYEAAAKARPLAPKSFLFTTVRHLMADRVRRQRIVSIETVADLETLDVLVDEITPERRTSARQELRRLSRAFERLPEKCRNVVWLRKVEDLSQREVAQRLGIAETTVEKHVAKGALLLAELLFGAKADALENAAAESNHDQVQRHRD